MRLSAKNISFKYSSTGPQVLSDVNFSAESGSYWCIAGPNGSGKSTFLKLACGLLPNELMKGELLWNERPLSSFSRIELAQNIAFVPGTLRTQFPVTVEDFVVQGRYAHSHFWSRPSSKDRDIAAASLDKAKITEISKSLITETSAGETQLALIARALAQNPKVLVLDEATANLDIGHQAQIFSLLKDLNKEGLTILLVSHDLNVAAEFCPNVMWMNNGTSFAQGPMADTLTTKLMHEIYGGAGQIEIGKNPFTSKPKVFLRSDA